MNLVWFFGFEVPDTAGRSNDGNFKTATLVSRSRSSLLFIRGPVVLRYRDARYLIVSSVVSGFEASQYTSCSQGVTFRTATVEPVVGGTAGTAITGEDT